MKGMTTFSGVVNVAVIVGIGLYFWSRAGLRHDLPPSSESFLSVDLSEEEWQNLVIGGARLGHKTAGGGARCSGVAKAEEKT